MLDSGPRTARPEGGSQREPVRWTAMICIDEAATNALSQKGISAGGFIPGIRDQLAEESTGAHFSNTGITSMGAGTVMLCPPRMAAPVSTFRQVPLGT